MRQTLSLIVLALAAGTAQAQLTPSQHPTDGNGPTPPASTTTDPMAPPATSNATGSRPPAAQNPTDGNGPSASGSSVSDVTAPPATAGAPLSTVPGSGAPGTDDVSAPSTHTHTPDQMTHKKKRRPHA